MPQIAFSCPLGNGRLASPDVPREQGAGRVQLEQQAQDWNELAELDPYWAILTASGKRFGGWNTDEFFATGPPRPTR